MQLLVPEDLCSFLQLPIEPINASRSIINIRRPCGGPLLGSSRDLAATPEEWLYTVLPSAQLSGRPSLSHVGRIIICPCLRGDESGKVPGGRCSSLLLSPFYNVKMHIPKSRRTTRQSGSDSRSRSPLSIRALRSARNDPLRQGTLERPLSDLERP